MIKIPDFFHACIGFVYSLRSKIIMTDLLIFYLSISTMNTSFYIHRCLAYIYVCVPHVCLLPMEAKRGHQIPWYWGYRWKPPCACWELNRDFSEKAASALSMEPSLQAQTVLFLLTTLHCILC